MRLFLTAADLSPAQANIAKANVPTPAARIAAAPEPFVRVGALGEVALFGMVIFLLPGSVESCDRPGPAHTCQSSRQRSPRPPPQQTRPRQSRAPQREVSDGS